VIVRVIPWPPPARQPFATLCLCEKPPPVKPPCLCASVSSPARANPVHPTARASITITSTASLSTSTTPSATATNPNTDRKRTKAASCDNSRDPTYT
jgi:hypothetical protein